MAEIGTDSNFENFFDSSEEAETEHFRTALVSILMENTDLDTDTIYEIVLNEGRNIIWS